MKASHFKVVAEVRRAAKVQLRFFNKMMAAKKAEEASESDLAKKILPRLPTRST